MALYFAPLYFAPFFLSASRVALKQGVEATARHVSRGGRHAGIFLPFSRVLTFHHQIGRALETLYSMRFVTNTFDTHNNGHGYATLLEHPEATNRYTRVDVDQDGISSD